jgi:DNA sulfur modification protein DndB
VNLYPALKASMGSWTYYIVKMKMRDLAKEVNFASEIYDDQTLNDAIQRVLNEGRVKNEIVSFLSRREDRFFSSVVVAALGGNPSFYPVEITDDKRFQVFRDQGIDDSFGVLTFSGDQKYFALDGQHRLKAIKTLLDPTEEVSAFSPDGFDEEEMSVLMVVQDSPDAEFLKAYRRLFSSLNRYAKATDADTNIIMDEDDGFAILTRRLITEHEFFGWSGKQQESARVKTKGKNLSSSNPHFTSLQTLYAMNETLLSSQWRHNSGWPNAGSEIGTNTKEFKRFRPDEELLDSLYEELALYWDSLVQALPFLRNEPATMRVHNLQEEEGEGGTERDNVLFWPIGQEMFAHLVRALLDKNLADPINPSPEEVLKAIEPLAIVEWELHSPPWRNLLLIHKPENNTWTMRNESRSLAVEFGLRLLRWLTGIDEHSSDDLDELKAEWASLLLPPLSEDDQKDTWAQILQQKVS